MRDAKQNIGLVLKGLTPDQNVCSGGKQKFQCIEYVHTKTTK